MERKTKNQFQYDSSKLHLFLHMMRHKQTATLISYHENITEVDTNKGYDGIRQLRRIACEYALQAALKLPALKNSLQTQTKENIEVYLKKRNEILIV